MNVKETLEDLGYHVADYGNTLLVFSHGDFIIRLEKAEIHKSDEDWYTFKNNYSTKINPRNVKEIIDMDPF